MSLSGDFGEEILKECCGEYAKYFSYESDINRYVIALKPYFPGEMHTELQLCLDKENENLYVTLYIQLMSNYLPTEELTLMQSEFNKAGKYVNDVPVPAYLTIESCDLTYPDSIECMQEAVEYIFEAYDVKLRLEHQESKEESI